MKDGKAGTIALNYQGNVVANKNKAWEMKDENYYWTF